MSRDRNCFFFFFWPPFCNIISDFRFFAVFWFFWITLSLARTSPPILFGKILFWVRVHRDPPLTTNGSAEGLDHLSVKKGVKMFRRSYCIQYRAALRNLKHHTSIAHLYYKAEILQLSIISVFVGELNFGIQASYTPPFNWLLTTVTPLYWSHFCFRLWQRTTKNFGGQPENCHLVTRGTTPLFS